MPNDVKAIVSAVTLLVGIAFAAWERWNGQAHLFWLVLALAVFAVAAMWVFPEASAKTDDAPPRRAGGERS